MAEKNAPATIWACMEGPMVGLFVSGGYTAGWPKYIRADSHDKVVDALKEARTFIEAEYRDPSTEPDGEWLAKDARPVHALICAALASLDQESGQ